MLAEIRWRWEWLLLLVFAAVGLAPRALRWLRRKTAEQWPTTEGTIEAVEVRPTKQFLVFTTPRSWARSYTAELVYSYAVEGSHYSGCYGREFATETEASEFLRELQGKRIDVHVSGRNPNKSSLAEEDVEKVLRTRSPAAVGVAELANVPDWVRPLLWPLIFIAAAGFCTSVYFHMDTFLRHRPVPEPLFGLLHVGIFVIWFPALLVGQKRFGSMQRRDFWKVLLRGAPSWLRYLAYGFFAYGVVMDFLTFFVYSSARRQDDPVFTSRGFSATWRTFYLIGFISLYVAARAEASSPKCLNGHPAAPGDRFCARCGQPIRMPSTKAVP